MYGTIIKLLLTEWGFQRSSKFISLFLERKTGSKKARRQEGKKKRKKERQRDVVLNSLVVSIVLTLHTWGTRWMAGDPLPLAGHLRCKNGGKKRMINPRQANAVHFVYCLSGGPTCVCLCVCACVQLCLCASVLVCMCVCCSRCGAWGFILPVKRVSVCAYCLGTDVYNYSMKWLAAV